MSSPHPPRRAGRVAVRIVQVALLVLVAWGVYRVLAAQVAPLSWEDLTRWRPSAAPLIASFIILVAGVYIAHALLWRRVVRDLRLGDLSLRHTIRVYFTASLGRYVPGKVWQLAGMAVLAGRAGLPPVAATAAAVLGQIAYLTTGVLFLALTLPGWQQQYGGRYGPLTAALVAGLAIGAALIWLMAATPFGHAARERLARRGGAAADKLGAALALADRITAGNAGIWAGAYFATWIALGAAFVLFVTAFVPSAADSPRYLAGTIAASYLLGYVVPLPAGIGAREGVMLVLLRPVVPDAGAAIVISALSRLWFTLAELVPLAFVPALPGDPKEDRS